MTVTQFITLISIGLAAGLVSGALGVGGGIIIVPALVFFMGFSQHMAQGTSISILMFPVVIMAAMQYYKNGYVDVKVVLVMLLFFVAGAYLGSLISISLPDKVLRKVFGIFMFLVSLKMILGR